MTAAIEERSTFGDRARVWWMFWKHDRKREVECFLLGKKFKRIVGRRLRYFIFMGVLAELTVTGNKPIPERTVSDLFATLDEQDWPR